MKVKFFYSTKDKPGEQYPCNITAALDKVKALKNTGVDVEAIDVSKHVIHFRHIDRLDVNACILERLDLIESSRDVARVLLAGFVLSGIEEFDLHSFSSLKIHGTVHFPLCLEVGIAQPLGDVNAMLLQNRVDVRAELDTDDAPLLPVEETNGVPSVPDRGCIDEANSLETEAE